MLQVIYNLIDSNNLEVFKKSINQISNKEELDSILEYIIKKERINFIKFILNCNLFDKEDIFLFSILENSYFIVKEIIKDEELNIKCRDNLGIKIACSNGYYHVFSLLFNHKKFCFYDINNIFYSAANGGHIKIIEEILYNKKTQEYIIPSEALSICCLKGNLSAVKSLVKYQKNNNQEFESNLLVLAFSNEHWEIIEYLISDCKLNPLILGDKLIRKAISNNKINILKLLWSNIKVNEFLKKDKKLYKEFIKIKNLKKNINLF